MNLDLLWGLLTLAACAAALIALAPVSLRIARTAYAESVEEPERVVWPPRQSTLILASQRIRPSDDPVWPIRPAA